MLNRITIYIVGLMISALGIAIVIRTSLGTGPWDTVGVGLHHLFGLTIGTWIIITQSSAIFLAAMIEKKRPKFESALVVIVRSWFLDIWFYLVLVHVVFPTSLLGELMMFIIGVVLIGGGIGIYIEAKFPYSPLDHLMIVMSEKYRMGLNLARRIIEITGMLIGFIIGGPVGIGTVILALFLGNIIQISNKTVQVILDKLNITLVKKKRIGV